MENNKKDKEADKTGLIPDEQLKGSDADKAYDENGDVQSLEKSGPAKTDKTVSPGADAEGEA